MQHSASTTNPQTHRLNEFGQPIGLALPNWVAPPVPPREPIVGRYCRLEPIDADAHGPGLWAAYLDMKGANWTYMLSGPFDSYEAYHAFLKNAATKSDPMVFAILTAAGKPVGKASFMRIDPSNGCIEVGGLNFSSLLQHTTAATEAMYLMMKRAFELGYRRYEWKCDSLNEPSRRAAKRLGFTYEGRFRQAIVIKGYVAATTLYDASRSARASPTFSRLGTELTPLAFQTYPRHGLVLCDR